MRVYYGGQIVRARDAILRLHELGDVLALEDDPVKCAKILRDAGEAIVREMGMMGREEVERIAPAAATEGEQGEEANT